MFKLTSSQIEALRDVTVSRHVARMAGEIYQRINEANATLLEPFSQPEALRLVEETIRAAFKYDIVDFDDLCKWSYLRLATNQEFYKFEGFRYFLDDPLIHPKAKAHNIVAAFQLAIQGRM